MAVAHDRDSKAVIDAEKRAEEAAKKRRDNARRNISAILGVVAGSLSDEELCRQACQNNFSPDCELLCGGKLVQNGTRSGDSGVIVLLAILLAAPIYFLFKAMLWTPPALILNTPVPLCPELLPLPAGDLSDDDLINLCRAPFNEAGKTLITLRTGQSVTWWKSLTFAPTQSTAMLTLVRSSDGVTLEGSAHEASILISNSDLQNGRLWFGKAKFLGVHWLTYYLDTSALAPYAGENLIFTWQRDQVAGQSAVIG